ncbi:NlpC/P60 family protein [Thermodesulfobacteriota bacterium]
MNPIKIIKVITIGRLYIPAMMACLFLVFIIGCGGDSTVSRDTTYSPPPKHLPPMRHTIQVGAFSNMSNAVRFTEKLQAQGLNAYHFRHDSGLYKVRFGNYSSQNFARKKAENLKTAGMIDQYYIVGPKDYATLSYQAGDNDYLRNEIVRTAKQYIGVPYQWGGQSPDTGFDCSGLTMVVYQLNGLDLPRSSRQQWKAGRPVKRGQVARGDLVFFATSGGTRVSHVGIYTGNGKFLHAPRRGRKIRIASLSNPYYKARYVGAKSYL